MRAVVLGASTGTGFEVIKRLAIEGYAPIGFHRGRHMEGVHQLLRSVPHIALEQSDVGSNYGRVLTGLDCIATHLGREKVNVFVHALSGAAVGKALDHSTKDVEQTFNTQAHSFFWWAQGMYNRKLLAPNAQLIALTNPVTTNYLSGGGVIGPAKAALEAYVRILGIELGRANGAAVFGIRFGAIATPALKEVIGESAIRKMERLHTHISPTGRMQTAEEIAHFISLLVAHPHITTALNSSVIDFTHGADKMLMDYAFNR